MRRALLFSVGAAIAGFLIGRMSLARSTRDLEARLRTAERERDETRRAKIEISQWASHGPDPVAATPPAPRPPLIDGGGSPTQGNLPIEHLISVDEMTNLSLKHAKTTLDEVARAASLTPAQLASLTQTVEQMNQALAAPIDELEAIEKGTRDGTLVSFTDWADANVAMLTTIKSADETFRQSLSPQQRELVDQQGFHVTSQANEASFWRLLEIGAPGVDVDTSEYVDDSAPAK